MVNGTLQGYNGLYGYILPMIYPAKPNDFLSILHVLSTHHHPQEKTPTANRDG